MKKKSKINQERLWMTCLMIPFIVYLIMFRYIPLFGWVFAFTNYRPGRSITSLSFEGLTYFKFIFTYWRDVLNAIVNTLALSGMSLATMVLPMIFALLLNEIKSSKCKKLIQTTVILPHFIGWVIVYALCFALFSTNGMVNTLLSALGTDLSQNILAKKNTIWQFMVALGIWKELGWSAIIYLAAIAAVDAELYDAAKIDGAGRLAIALNVTLPGLISTFIVLLVLNIGNLLNLGMDKYLMFSNTVTASKLEIIDLYTYRMGIGNQQYSFATAVSILKSIFSITMIILANLVAKKLRGSTIV